MASDEGDNSVGMTEVHAEVSVSSIPEEDLRDVNHKYKDGSNVNLILENGFSDGKEGQVDDTHDELLQMAVDLRFQNEFLKSQFEGFSNVNSVPSGFNTEKGVGDREDGESDIVKELQGRLESLNKEFLEEKQTRIASEEALKHLQVAYSEAEAQAQKLSEKLVEGLVIFLYMYEIVKAVHQSWMDRFYIIDYVTICILTCLGASFTQREIGLLLPLNI